MKKITVLLFLIVFSTNLFSQEKSKWDNYIEKVRFPFYTDLELGLMTTHPTSGFTSNHLSASFGVPINEKFGLGIDFMSGVSDAFEGSYTGFSGIGLQGRYLKSRWLGQFTIGQVRGFGFGSELDYNLDVSVNDWANFYLKTGISYRFWKVCSVGFRYYVTTPTELKVIDGGNQYFTNRQVHAATVTFGIHLFPPYSLKRK